MIQMSVSIWKVFWYCWLLPETDFSSSSMHILMMKKGTAVGTCKYVRQLWISGLTYATWWWFCKQQVITVAKTKAFSRQERKLFMN